MPRLTASVSAQLPPQVARSSSSAAAVAARSSPLQPPVFPKAQRLPRASFGALARGRRLSSPHFSLVSSGEALGYAVVVAKKGLPLATDRHLLKRRVLGVLRSLPELPRSLVVYPKPSALSLSAGELRAELAALVSKY